MNERKILGSGTYSIVYLHVDKDGNEYAVKEQLKALNEIPMSAIREVIITKKISHPNIISYTKIEFNETEIKLIMPLAKTTLDKIILSSSQKTLREFFSQICKGVNVLHSNNIIHGDLKGPNILIIDNKAVITDFGISAINASNGVCNSELYSLWYRPIDLLLGGNVGFHSDIWALGCILFEMNTETFLFAEYDENEQIKMILTTLGDIWTDIRKLPRWKKRMNKYFSEDPYRISLKDRLTDAEASNLIKRMIVANPDERISISEILTSDYIGESGDSIKELTIDKKLINNENELPKIEKQRDKRGIVIEWMIEVFLCRFFDLSTLTLAVSIYDKTIDRITKIDKSMLQSIASSCLIIAFKLLEDEIDLLVISSLTGGIPEKEIADLIPLILELLNFDVYYSTIGDFFNYFSKSYSDDIIKLAKTNLYCFLLSAKLQETYKPSNLAMMAFKLSCMFNLKHAGDLNINVKEIKNEIIEVINNYSFVRNSFFHLSTVKLNDYMTFLKK